MFKRLSMQAVLRVVLCRVRFYAKVKSYIVPRCELSTSRESRVTSPLRATHIQLYMGRWGPADDSINVYYYRLGIGAGVQL